MVEAAAARQGHREIGFGEALPVVFDHQGDRIGVNLRRDANTRAGMARGIVDQIAEHFVEIVGIDRQADIVEDVNNQRLAFGVRRSLDHAYDAAGGLAEQRGDGTHAVTDPGARQFSLDMAPHRVGEGFEVAGDFTVATFPQPADVGGKCCERCLQPVRQIGGPIPRTDEFALLRIEQGIHFGDERFDLRRNLLRQPPLGAAADLRNRGREGGQRAQTRGDLDPDPGGKHEAERDQYVTRISGKATFQLFQFPPVDRHRDAHMVVDRGDRNDQAPFMREQDRALRPGDVARSLRAGEQFALQRENGVPQRTGGDASARGVVLDLPVEPPERPCESRVGRLARQAHRALRVDAQRAGDGLDMGVEFLADAPVEMAGEQRRQADPGDEQRDRQQAKPERQKPEPERATACHGTDACSLGTR